MTAAGLRRQGVASAIVFFSLFVVTLLVSSIGPWWFVGFGIVTVVVFFWFGFCTVGVRVVMQREFSHGYTTMKSLAGRYRFVDPKTIKHGHVPASGTDPALFQPQLVQLRPIGQSAVSSMQRRTGRRRVLLIPVLSVVVLWAIALIKLVSVATVDPSGLPIVGLVMFGTFSLIVGVVLVPGSVASWLALCRVRRVDQGTLVLVSPNVVLRQTVTSLYPGSFVGEVLVLAIDAEGIRFWNSNPAASGLIVRIPWAEVVDIGYVDAATIGSGYGDRIVIRARLAGDKLCDLPFQPLRYIQMLPATQSRRHQIAATLITTREATAQPTP